jgi:hypothetical protein
VSREEDTKESIIDIKAIVSPDNLTLHHLKPLNQLLLLEMDIKDHKEEVGEVIIQDSHPDLTLEHHNLMEVILKGVPEVIWEVEKLVM